MPCVEKSDWSALLAPLPLPVIEGHAWRVVENHSQAATLSLVDDLDEQSILESLLEKVKPAFPAHAKPLHPLLASPFRYPPLRWGSRFGGQFEPSLFYGSLELDTALAEVAYYRLLFLFGMTTQHLPNKLRSQHCAFVFSYRCVPGAQLQKPPFDDFAPALKDPVSYAHSQALGAALRTHNVQGFEFFSARCRHQGINLCLMTPEAFTCDSPTSQQHWMCETNADQITFFGERRLVKFDALPFLRDGVLPVVGG